MILQQNQYHQKFYDPIISNTTEKLVSPKVNQKGQEEDPTSQKSNRVQATCVQVVMSAILAKQVDIL